MKAEGPRIVVFDVSGTIKLQSNLSIKNPYITIAGQTAPGDGICLRGGCLSINTDQVNVRHIRARAGNEIHTLDGIRRNALQRGVNIIRTTDNQIVKSFSSP